MLVDSLWCDGRERRRQTSCLMLDSMRIGSLTPVSLGNGKFIGNLFSFASVTLYRKIIILFYFPIGLVYMVLFWKASGFLIFMHIFVYFYV